MTMKTAGLFFMLGLAVTASAQTNQSWPVCRYPVRVFGDAAVVNLSPLFQWWQQQPTAGNAATNPDDTAGTGRPLSAWQRITGTKIGIAGSDWVVKAVIYDRPTVHTNARIFLSHPPAAEEQMFYALKTQLAETERQITNAQRSYQADTKAAQAAEDHARTGHHSRSRATPDGANNYTQLAAQKREAATAALNQQKELEAAHALIKKQLNAIPAMNGQYRLDWFALAAGQTKAGVPIYDLGVVNTISP